MAILQWLHADYINGYAVITLAGRVVQFNPPNGFVFYYGVYVFAAFLIVLGLRKYLGGEF
jgi:hypothetical protein